MDPEQDGFDIDAGVAEIAAGMGFEAEEDVPADAPVEAPIEEPAPEVVVRSAPKSWPKEYHEHWGKLPQEAQDIIERREQDFHQGLEQYREYHGFGKKMQEAFAPYKQMIESQGLDEAKAAQFLLNAHHRLATLPQQERLGYWAQIASNYGIQVPGLNDQQQDPRYSALEQQVQQMARAQMQQQQREYDQKLSQVSNDVSSFADAKDATGNLKHPYFNDVADTIVILLNGGASLQDAYDQAVWANPVTRAKETARLKTETEKSLREKSKTEAEKARQASSANVRDRDTRKAPTEPLGKMEDTMKETLADIKARTH